MFNNIILILRHFNLGTGRFFRRFNDSSNMTRNEKLGKTHPFNFQSECSLKVTIHCFRSTEATPLVNLSSLPRMLVQGSQGRKELTDYDFGKSVIKRIYF